MLVRTLSLIVALALISQMTLFIEIGPWYYNILFFSCLIIIPFEKVIKFNFNVILFIIAILLSVIVNDVPGFFRPFERLISLTLLLILFGPLFLSNRKYKFNYYLLNFIIYILYLFQILSFVLYLLNFEIVFGESGYVGLFSHSMVMGPLSAISILFSLDVFLTKKKFNFYFFIICLVSFLNLLLASSRSAIVAVALAIIMLFYFHSTNRVQFFKKMAVIFAILFLITPYLYPYMEGVFKKMELASDNNDLTLTRTQLWSIRISEFLRSPLFGIGYSNDTSLNHLFLSSNEKVKLEPGSSWLAILSMTGIFGFIFFLRVLYSSLKKIKLKYKNSKLLVSVIIFYLIHFIAEGYVISGGSGLNLFFWLILGILYSYNSKISYKTK